MREREAKVGLNPDDAATKWLDGARIVSARHRARGHRAGETSAASAEARGLTRRWYRNALSPVSARPISSFWICHVPS